MLFKLSSSFFLALALAGVTRAASTEWSGSSAITFSGTSTLHSWSGKVNAEPFKATVDMDAAGQPTKLRAKVLVKAGAMDTAEPDRDTKMHKSMQVTTHPLIEGVMDTSFAQINGADGKPTKLPFDLAILGKAQKVEASLSNWSRKGDTATFDFDFELSLKKCGITVPSVLLVVRVGDTIEVHGSVKLILAK